MRKIISVLTAAVLAVGMTVVLTACGSAEPKDINLNDYVQFSFTGTDGYGRSDYSFDRSAFIDDYGDTLAFIDDKEHKNENAAVSFADGMADFGTLSKEWGLANGDAVSFTWNIDQEKIESEYRVSLTYSNMDITVEGLDDSYIDIISLTCNMSNKTLPVNGGEEITFKAEIDSDKDISDSVMLAGDDILGNTYSFQMNDNGTDGDKYAGDGIYTYVMTNDIDSERTAYFYIRVDGKQGNDIIKINFSDDPEEEETTDEPEETTSRDISSTDEIIIGSAGNTESTVSENTVLTKDQTDAIDQAEVYLDAAVCSRSGMIDHLVDEGYSQEDAEFAADNCGADWFDQALQRADDYIGSHDISTISYEDFIGRIMDFGFTHPQAEYAADNCGIIWNN